jgi:hypothetical protein
LLRLLASFTLFPVFDLAAAVSEHRVVQRGQNHALIQNITERVEPRRGRTFFTNQFTLLENCLHYQDNGEWKLSESLIEPFPDGAVARRGPNKAIFSHALNSEAVFDIQTSDGRRIRGGVRAIHLTDQSTGKTIVLGTVKESAKAELLPPNEILFRDAFDGIAAHVLLVWKYNYFSHDVILAERPAIPADWDPANVRLEVLTEFIVDAEPQLRAGLFQQREATDDQLIHFGSMAIVVGKAFPVDEAFSLGGEILSEGTPVVKQWHRLEDGRRFLVESLKWADAAPHLQNLPARPQANNAPKPEPEVAHARVWPSPAEQLARREPIQLASSTSKPGGYLIDFVTIPDDATPTTFLTGETYYVPSSYYSGNSITFQSGTVVKYKDTANMLLYGSLTFPSSGDPAVFTSRNDDLYGERIQGVTGETDSDGDPTLHKASKALWIYYPAYANTIRNVLIRWAKIGVQFDYSSVYQQGLTIQNSLFEHITGSGSAGVAGDTSYYVSVSNLKRCNVTTPGVTMTLDCSGSIDSDGDALLDSWEVTHFGNTTSQNGSDDPDGDGLNNHVECYGVYKGPNYFDLQAGSSTFSVG